MIRELCVKFQDMTNGKYKLVVLDSDGNTVDPSCLVDGKKDRSIENIFQAALDIVTNRFIQNQLAENLRKYHDPYDNDILHSNTSKILQ